MKGKLSVSTSHFFRPCVYHPNPRKPPRTMAISAKLEKKLAKPYAPSSRIDEVYLGNDITIISNDRGEAIHLFIGKRNEDGSIRGEHYARRIQREPGSDRIIKSHWDNKGKVTRASS